MENNKTFSCLAILNQFPGIRFRVHVCNHHANKNGTTSCKEDRMTAFDNEHHKEMIVHRNKMNSFYEGLPETPYHEANFYIIVKNKNVNHKN